MNSDSTSRDKLGMDYLVIGHITEDITPQGLILGGGVTYSALTAQAMGLNAGIITACAPGLDLSALHGIEVISQPSPFTTTFKNISQGTNAINTSITTPISSTQNSSLRSGNIQNLCISLLWQMR